MGKKGFTLTEILVVVIIIAVLAALAIPRYIKSVETGRAKEARVNLNLILTAQKLYSLDHSGLYLTDGDWAAGVPWGASVCSGCGRRHYYIDNISALVGYYDYNITTNTTDTFTARATRKTPAPGDYGGDYYEIDETGNITGPTPD